MPIYKKGTHMDKIVLKDIRGDLTKVLGTLSEKYNVVFDIGTFRYNENTFKVTLEATKVDPEHTQEKKMVVDFKSLCHKFGLKKEDLGKTFFSIGEAYRIVGLKPKNRKYPIIAEKVDSGKSFKFSQYTVLRSKGQTQC